MSIQKIAEYSELADASYANFGDLTDSAIKAGLEARHIPSAEITNLMANYLVVSQEADEGSGFSATVFYDKANTKHIFAARGIEL